MLYHPITLIGSTGVRETLMARVDTSAVFATVPSAVLERLGVRPHRNVRMRFTDGTILEWELGDVLAELGGEQYTIICIFGAEDSQPTLGRHTLDTFQLAVDPVGHKLVPKDIYLMAGVPVP